MSIEREKLTKFRFAAFGALAQWKDIQEALEGDVTECRKMISENIDSGWRRSYMRPS